MAIKTGYEHQPLWQGPSKLTTVRTSKILPLNSLLDPNDDEGSGMNKKPRTGPVYLGHAAFDQDERAYEEHREADRAVLQYNSQHYKQWKSDLDNIALSSKSAREQLLSTGGFGENFAANADHLGIFMDEHTVCVGDVIGIVSPVTKKINATIQITGPRNPCYKLNHRFGIKNMAQRAQESFRTGWLSQTIREGYVEINDQLVLLERPLPDWPVARVQYLLYKDPRNFDMISQCLADTSSILLQDIKNILNKRLSKGVENWAGRLGISSTTPETFSTFRLTSKIKETSRVSSFVFTRAIPYPNDDIRLVQAEPGSHIRLRMNITSKGQPIQIIRPYSVISGTTNSFTLGVALADISRGGSSFLHTLQPGDVIQASDKFANTFPLSQDAEKHIFLAGGIGITAFLDHISHCRQNKIPFELHYMVRDEADVAFLDLLQDSCPITNGTPDQSRSINIYVSSQRRADILSILSTSRNAHIYTCGSSKLSTAVQAYGKTLNIPESYLHFEQFTVDASGDPFTVELAKTMKVFEVPEHMSLLEAMQDAGYTVPSSCEAGNCGTCRIRVLSGNVEHRGTALSEDEKAVDGDGEMLACVSRGAGRICIDW